MKMLNKIFFLFFINCIFVFSVENNNFNSEKLGENDVWSWRLKLFIYIYNQKIFK